MESFLHDPSIFYRLVLAFFISLLPKLARPFIRVFIFVLDVPSTYQMTWGHELKPAKLSLCSSQTEHSISYSSEIDFLSNYFS